MSEMLKVEQQKKESSISWYINEMLKDEQLFKEGIY